MQQKNQNKGTSIYKKIFRSMSGISVSFILVMLLCSVYIFSRWFFDTHKKANIDQLEYISQQIDIYLSTVENFSKSIIINSIVHDHVIKFAECPSLFTAADQNAIRQEINRTIQSTPYIHSVTVYSPDNDIIASTEVHSSPTQINLDDTLNRTDGVWVESIKKTASTKMDMKTFSFIRPFWDYSTGSFIGYLEIAVPEVSISQIYSSKASDMTHYYICSSDRRIISSDLRSTVDTRLPGKNRDFSGQMQVFGGSIWFSCSYQRMDWQLLCEQELLYFVYPFGLELLIFLVLAAICIIICFILARHISSHITRPLYRLIAHTHQIKKGNWSPVREVPDNDSDMQILYESFNSMLAAQEQLKNDLIQAQKNKDKLKLELLQQQINPHFLYNTLDNICSLAELDEKEALIDIVMSLSTFYRKGLSGGKSFVTLKDELNMTEAYLHIMSIRYFHKFRYRIDCPKSLCHVPCLKFLLQPAVENSIYYGIKEMSGEGLLTISIEDHGEAVSLFVEDNGAGISSEKISEAFQEDGDHFGLKNIHKRIQLYYGPQYGITLENRLEGGCRVCIRIGKNPDLFSASSLSGVAPKS